MSERLAVFQKPLPEFLAYQRWGVLRLATTERGGADHRKILLRLVFSSSIEYTTCLKSTDDALNCFKHIVAYLQKYGYDHPEYFVGERIKIDLIFGNFCRNTDDVKRELRIFEPDVPAQIDLNGDAEKFGLLRRSIDDLKRDLGLFKRADVPIKIDLNREADELGLSCADALKAMKRQALENAAREMSAPAQPDQQATLAADAAGTLQQAATDACTPQPADDSTLRLKWGQDSEPDENPAAFAWRAYQAEAEAGTLHRGVILRNDDSLYRALRYWLESNPMPEGIDIPTKKVWNTRQIEAGKAERGKIIPPPRTTKQRLYEVARDRIRKGHPVQPAF
jgi:hypothetical protein